MPKGKKAANDGGAAQSRQQEIDDLVAHHVARIRAHQPLIDKQQAVVKEEKAKLAELQATQSDMYLEAKADTRFDREDLQWAVKALDGGGRTLLKHQRARAAICRALGYPYQAELDLDGQVPDEARDELDWNTDGYLAGRRAAEPSPPRECPERFVQAWMAGYHKGQEVNGEQLSRAAVIIEERSQPSTAPAVEVDPEAEEAALDDQVERLRRSDFMKTGAGEDASEAQPADAA